LSGLPGETMETLEETKQFAGSLGSLYGYQLSVPLSPEQPCGKKWINMIWKSSPMTGPRYDAKQRHRNNLPARSPEQMSYALWPSMDRGNQ